MCPMQLAYEECFSVKDRKYLLPGADISKVSVFFSACTCSCVSSVTALLGSLPVPCILCDTIA
jgi:hypothetical protein